MRETIREVLKEATLEDYLAVFVFLPSAMVFLIFIAAVMR